MKKQWSIHKAFTLGLIPFPSAIKLFINPCIFPLFFLAISSSMNGSCGETKSSLTWEEVARTAGVASHHVLPKGYSSYQELWDPVKSCQPGILENMAFGCLFWWQAQKSVAPLSLLPLLYVSQPAHPTRLKAPEGSTGLTPTSHPDQCHLHPRCSQLSTCIPHTGQN